MNAFAMNSLHTSQPLARLGARFALRSAMVSMKAIAKGKIAMKAVPKSAAKAATTPAVETTLALPGAFSEANASKPPKQGIRAKKDLVAMTEQEQRNAISKRESSSFKWALKSAPPKRLQEYEAIMSEKGAGRMSQLKAFKQKYLSNMNWDDCNFSEKLESSWAHTTTIESSWISFGRFQKLVGKAEAANAVKGKWHPMRAGKHDGQLGIFTSTKRKRSKRNLNISKGSRQTLVSSARMLHSKLWIRFCRKLQQKCLARRSQRRFVIFFLARRRQRRSQMLAVAPSNAQLLRCQNFLGQRQLLQQRRPRRLKWTQLCLHNWSLQMQL